MRRQRMGRVSLFVVLAVSGSLVSGCKSLHGSEAELTYTNAAELVGAIGCSGYSAAGAVPHANANGTCSFQGETIHLYTFDNDEQRNIWIKSSAAAAWLGDGDSWVITGDAPGAVAAATNAAGGEPVLHR